MKKIFSVFLAGMFLATAVFGAGITKTEYSSSDASSAVMYGTADAGDTIVRVKTAADGTLQANITGSMSDVSIADATISGTWTTTASWVGDFPITGDMNVTGDFTTSGSFDWSGGNVVYVPLTGSIEAYHDAATAGDTLVLASGTYTITDDIDVTKAINIVGQGIGKTIINNATDNVDMFDITVSNVRISDITITNSGGTNYKSSIKSSGNLTGLVFENIRVVDSKSGSTAKIGFNLIDSSAELTNCYVSTAGRSSVSFQAYTSSSASANATVKLTDCWGVSTGATSEGLNSSDISSTFDCLVYTFGGYYEGTTSGGSARSGADAFLYATGTTFKGGTQDVLQVNSATLTLYDCTLVNNTTSGTITYGGTVVSSKVHADGVTTSTNFKKCMTVGGLTIWISDGTTAEGALTGVEGDICLNGGTGAGQAAYCDANGTNWTDM